MGAYFSITISQIAMMFAFIVIGWILRRTRILPEDTGTVISKLLVWIFIPASVIKSLATNFTVPQLSQKIFILIAGIIVVTVCFIIAQPLGKLFGTDDYSKKVYAYSFVVPNTSYVGIPLVLAIFGENVTCDMVVFTIPVMLVMYTWGMYVLTKQEKISFKSMNNPVIYSIVIGMILGLCGIELPGIVNNVLDNASNCLAPCAMLLAGFVVGKSSLKTAFGNGRAYIASIIRLLVLPAVIAIPMLLLGIDKEITFIATLVTAMPMGLNSIVFPEAVGQDSSAGASTVVISHIMCIITVPVITGILMSI